MGWLSVLIGLAGAWGFYADGRLALMWIEIATTIVALWSYGVMHNFAVASAKRRADYNGGFYVLTHADLNAVPDRLAQLNMLVSLAALILAIVAAVLTFWR